MNSDHWNPNVSFDLLVSIIIYFSLTGEFIIPCIWTALFIYVFPQDTNPVLQAQNSSTNELLLYLGYKRTKKEE